MFLQCSSFFSSHIKPSQIFSNLFLNILPIFNALKMTSNLPECSQILRCIKLSKPNEILSSQMQSSFVKCSFNVPSLLQLVIQSSSTWLTAPTVETTAASLLTPCPPAHVCLSVWLCLKLISKRRQKQKDSDNPSTASTADATKTS